MWKAQTKQDGRAYIALVRWNEIPKYWNWLSLKKALITTLGLQMEVLRYIFLHDTQLSTEILFI